MSAFSGEGGDHVLTVSEFSRALKGTLESEFGRVSVRGQISGLARPRSGHIYFSLVDDSPALGSRASNSQVGCVLWRSGVSRLRFDPENGMKVVVSGRLTIYEPRSVYQLVADRIVPEGVGDLQLAFEKLKARLEREGLFDEEAKRPIPFLPRRIGLVTSASGAAIRDFLRILFARRPRSWVRLIPVRVQGEGAAAEIADAIERLNEPDAGVDVIVVTRGGGSLEDLWAFNEEVVARALASSSVPTVSAVGHEIDFSIADFVADLRAPTPTAAATLVAPDVGELESRLDALRRGLVQGLRGVAARGENRLLRALSSRLFREPQLLVQERFGELDEALAELENHLYKRLDRCHDSLTLLGTRLQGLSPYAVLERGYAVVLDKGGRPVRRAETLAPGDAVELRFAEGSARALIESRETGPARTRPDPGTDESGIGAESRTASEGGRRAAEGRRRDGRARRKRRGGGGS